MINRFYILGLILFGALLWTGCDREGFITDPIEEEEDPDPQEVSDTKLSGTVLDMFSNGLSDTQVDIYLEGEHLHSTTTDIAGQFSFEQIDFISGTYRLVVNKEGYLSRTVLVETDAIELESVKLHLLENDNNQNDASIIDHNTTDLIEYSGRLLIDGEAAQEVSVFAIGLGVNAYIDYDFTDENGEFHLLLKTDTQYLLAIDAIGNQCVSFNSNPEIIGPFSENTIAQDRNIELPESNIISLQGSITSCGQDEDVEIFVTDDPENPSFVEYIFLEGGILDHEFEICGDVPENIFVEPLVFSQPWINEIFVQDPTESIELDLCDSTQNNTNYLNFWFDNITYDLSANVFVQNIDDENFKIFSEGDGTFIEISYKAIDEDIFIASSLNLLLSDGTILELSNNLIVGDATRIQGDLSGHFNSTLVDDTTGCPIIFGGFTILQ